jgi:dihydrofolate reductase
MRALIYTAFVSLDGVVEGPAPDPAYRNSGWTFQGIEFRPEVYELKGREQEEAGALMLGRVSYELFSPVWPSMTEEFPLYNAMPKYVVSRSLKQADLVDNWGETTIIRSLDDVAALKRTDGAPISVHASATLARNLEDAGLIDRYHLLVFPVILGAGKRMWSTSDLEKQRLELVESESYANGVQKLVYNVVR